MALICDEVKELVMKGLCSDKILDPGTVQQGKSPSAEDCIAFVVQSMISQVSRE